MLDRSNANADWNAETKGGEGGSFDLHEVLNFVWRQWKVIVGVAVLAILTGFTYLSRQTPIYTASAQLLLEPGNARSPGPDAAQLDAPQPIDLVSVTSQIDIIKSSSLLRRVVLKEKLVNDPEFGAGTAGGGLLQATGKFFGRSPTADPSGAADGNASNGNPDDPSPEVIQATERLKRAVGVSRPGPGLTLNVAVASADPVKAARLANAVADAYMVDKLDARFEAAKRASAWLNDRLTELRTQLHDSEEAVAQFRQQNNLVQTAPGATLTQEQLAQMNGRLVNARAESAEKKAALSQLQQAQAGGGNISALPEVMNDAAIIDLRKQENDVSRQVADLRTHYSDRYPAVVNLRAQLSDIRRAIDAEMARLIKNVADQYQLALARQQAIEKTLKEVSGETSLDNAKAITLRELERTAAVNKTLFENFLQRFRITEQQETFEAREARVISPALPPHVPTSPKKGQVMIISALLGLLGGVGAAYLLELLNVGFTVPRQVEDLLGLPLLGSVNTMGAQDLNVDGVALTIPQYAFVKPLSRFAESLRSVRSAIQMSDVDHPPKVVQVTSTIPGEGKSTICLAIAASAAQAGHRVLVIDADLRHPSVSKFFKAENAPGLVDLLVGTAEISKIVGFHADLKLWFLPAGAKTQNPADLLGSEKLKALVELFRDKFDLVMVDAPPVGPVTDPLIVSHLADKVVFVVRWAATAREVVADSIQRLSGHRKVAGVVFNRVIEGEAQKYGKGAYSYIYGGRYYQNYYHE